MRIRRGPATVTGDARRSASAATDPPRRAGKARRGRPGSQETCLRPKAHEALEERGLAHARHSRPAFCPARRPGCSAGRRWIAALCCAALAAMHAAHAAGPATVTVRVEGLEATTLPTTQVTTTAAPVIKDGNPEHSCAGTSAAGRSNSPPAGTGAARGSAALGYSVESIEGESHAFESGAPANYFWSHSGSTKRNRAWVCVKQNCSRAIRSCSSPSASGSDACPPSPESARDRSAAIANVEEPVRVTVERYDSSGNASFAGGRYGQRRGDTRHHRTPPVRRRSRSAHRASSRYRRLRRESVRTETTVCVHEGNDGTCGASGASGGATNGGAAGSGVAGTRNTAPFAIVASAIGLHEGRVYTAQRRRVC